MFSRHAPRRVSVPAGVAVPDLSADMRLREFISISGFCLLDDIFIIETVLYSV